MGNIEIIDIKQVKGHDVTFLRVFNYVCAYVRVNGDELHKEPYPYETLREKTFFGIDTAHGWNDKMSFEQKKEDAEWQISELIGAF